ncbi:MAG: DUF502 domain-containing protein [Candidatus Zixiibacteriota bacterium]|nr:MAG: DUF502 domain-containing protein [candidate division Zixibacteria bacterium]
MKNASLWRSIKLNLMAGLLVLLPAYLTYIILVRMFLIIDGIFNRMATRALVAALGLPLNGDRVIYGLGIITLFTVVLLAGYIARHYLGRKFIDWFNSQADQIPVVKSIYKTLRQLVEAFMSTNREAFQRPVLIEYPRKGLYSICFQTRNTSGPLKEYIPEDAITVFMPSTPNPTTGFVLVVPRSQVQELHITVEEAMKLIISGGVVASEGQLTSGPIVIANPATVVDSKVSDGS